MTGVQRRKNLGGVNERKREMASVIKDEVKRGKGQRSRRDPTIFAILPSLQPPAAGAPVGIESNPVVGRGAPAEQKNLFLVPQKEGFFPNAALFLLSFFLPLSLSRSFVLCRFIPTTAGLEGTISANLLKLLLPTLTKENRDKKEGDRGLRLGSQASDPGIRKAAHLLALQHASLYLYRAMDRTATIRATTAASLRYLEAPLPLPPLPFSKSYSLLSASWSEDVQVDESYVHKLG